jgi:hypothetical protein
MKERHDILIRELEKSGQKLLDLYKNDKEKYFALLAIATQFEDVLLLPYEIPIWWDFERFLHIYMRHVENVKTGPHFSDKTTFQYKFHEIRYIIKAVIETVYSDFQKHLQEYPERIFKRLGRRAVYYDGHYYRVEIEPTGKLVAFHPYNNANEMETDN